MSHSLPISHQEKSEIRNPLQESAAGCSTTPAPVGWILGFLGPCILPVPSCPVALVLSFLFWEGFPLKHNQRNQDANSFYPMATGHLSLWLSGSGSLDLSFLVETGRIFRIGPPKS